MGTKDVQNIPHIWIVFMYSLKAWTNNAKMMESDLTPKERRRHAVGTSNVTHLTTLYISQLITF